MMITGASRIGKSCFCLALAYLTFSPSEIVYGWDYQILLKILDPSIRCIIFDDAGKIFTKDAWKRFGEGRNLWQWICIFPKLYLFNTTAKSNVEKNLREFENVEELKLMRPKPSALPYALHKQYGIIQTELVDSSILSVFKLQEYKNKYRMTLDSILAILKGSGVSQDQLEQYREIYSDQF